MNRLKISILAAAAAIPLTAAVVASAAGPNILQNGDFSAGLANWTNWGGPALVQNQVINGELEVKNIYTGYGNSYVGATQCVTIEPGAQYTVDASAFIANGQTLEAGAGVYLFFRTDVNCGGQNLGGGHRLRGKQNPADRGSWISLTQNTTAPANAKTLAIYVDAVKEPLPQNYNQGVPVPFTVRFDNISVKKVTPDLPEPPKPIEQPLDQPKPKDQPIPQDDPKQQPEVPPVFEPPYQPPVTPNPVTPPTPETPKPEPEPKVPTNPQPQQNDKPAPTVEPVTPPTTEPETPAGHDVPLPPATGNASGASDGSRIPMLIGAGIAVAVLAAASRRLFRK